MTRYTERQLTKVNKETFNRPFVIMCILFGVLVIFTISHKGNKVSSNYQELSVWQLIDVKIWLQDQLSWLNKKIFDIDTIICWKEASLCVINGDKNQENSWVEETPMEQLNQSMGL